MRTTDAPVPVATSRSALHGLFACWDLSHILKQRGLNMAALVIKEGLVIPEEQLRWTFARSGGPGGQNVNKVSSKAILRWQPPPEFLPAGAWSRFRKLAARYVTEEGEVVIASDEYRDQPRNIERSREKLRALILTALVPPKRRIATKPTRSSRMRRLDDKRRASQKKTSRRTSHD